MTDRIPCKNPECSKTILPSTAEQTNGFCMPCVQAAARMKNEEYIRNNRRNLNEFEGITDPVELLKIIHRPRKFNPLINWIAYNTPTDQIYLNLSRDEQDRLAKYAELLIGTDRNDEAEEIVLCLSAFTDATVENCLRAFIAQNSIWPSLSFCRASAAIRDELISRVERDEENRNHILLALAWIGDSTVVKLFDLWRKHLPDWRGSLYTPPQDYSLEAGWEISDDGQRRDLYFHRCTKLRRGNSHSPQLFQAIVDRKDCCPWCNQKLIDLIDLVPSEFDLFDECDATDRIRVTTCQVCTAFGDVLGTFDESGSSQWSSFNVRPNYLSDDAETWGRLPQNSFTSIGRRTPLSAASQFLPTTFSQVGGHPTWIQDANYPNCPICSKTMMFLAQVDCDDIKDCSEGLFYAFVCIDCRMTATSYQQT
jgi:Domain of unknown function (DUF1963)